MMCRCDIDDCGRWPTPDYTLTVKVQPLEPFEPFDAIRECSGAFIAYVVLWFRHIHKGSGISQALCLSVSPLCVCV